jgi:hypothetical protein
MKSWLNMSIDLYCEWIPHLQLVVLPYGVDRADWYQLCCENLKTKWKVTDDEIPALTYFYQLLQQRYPFLKTSRRITLGRCFICIWRKLKLKSTDLSKEERQRITKEGETHLNEVMRERDKYKAVTLASRNPENQTMSIIFDKGNGPRIPHLAQYPKSWATLIRPKTNLFAFIRHDKMIKCLVPFMANFPDDPNFVMSLFFQDLVNASSEGDLPLYLHLQTDNCSKENKNQWLHALLACLVGLKIFKAIESDHLPTGHTHLDIDALLQPLAEGHTMYDCLSWSDFPAFLRKCYMNHKNQPIINALPKIYDWKGFLNPFMRSTTGISDFRSFKFEVLFFKR